MPVRAEIPDSSAPQTQLFSAISNRFTRKTRESTPVLYLGQAKILADSFQVHDPKPHRVLLKVMDSPLEFAILKGENNKERVAHIRHLLANVGCRQR
jgi:hypothetical protein